MKRPLSLLEVAIGMALTAILLTALFSTFRALVQTGASVQKIRNDKHWTYVTHLRLAQVFETMEEASYSEKVLSFTFNNGADPDPAFCSNIKGKLYVEEKTFTLELIAEQNRKECFHTEVKEWSAQFYDPKQKEWIDTWDEKDLFPLIRIHLNGETFAYALPHGNRRVVYE